jgi:hypothetical protein
MKSAVMAVVLVPLVAAVFATIGCGGSVDPGAPSAIKVEVSPHVATVVKVSWVTGKPTVGYVEYGLTNTLGSRTPLEAVPAETHAATLLGLRADTDYFYRVVASEPSAAPASSGIAKLHTKPLPVGIPALTMTGTGLDGFVVTPILGATRAVIMLDREGKIVWYRCIGKDAQGQPDCQAQEPAETRLESYRARLSQDGQSVVFNAAKISGEPSAMSELVRVSLDGSQTTSIPIPLLAHDFVEHPDGTLAAITFEDRDFEGTRFRGNTLVEVAPGGAKRTVWTSWNCFDPAQIKGEDLALGWTFANALDFDPAADAYYVGFRNFNSIAKVNRASGACEWVLGAGGGTFTFAAGSARFLHQHQFQVRGNKILVMDNDGMGGRTSRLLEYELDLTAMVATQIWSYVANPPVYTFVLGEPWRLSDGRTFVNWSAAGQLELLDAAGTQLWKVNTSAGVVFGFHTLARDLYAPGGGEPW